MLDDTMKQQLTTYLANLREPVELVASLGNDEKSRQTRELLEEIAGLHDMVEASFDGTDDRTPSFVIRRASDAEKWVRFAGLPMDTSSPRWCSRCSGPVAIRRRSMPICWSRSAASKAILSRCISL